MTCGEGDHRRDHLNVRTRRLSSVGSAASGRSTTVRYMYQVHVRSPSRTRLAITFRSLRISTALQRRLTRRPAAADTRKAQRSAAHSEQRRQVPRRVRPCSLLRRASEHVRFIPAGETRAKIRSRLHPFSKGFDEEVIAKIIGLASTSVGRRAREGSWHPSN